MSDAENGSSAQDSAPRVKRKDTSVTAALLIGWMALLVCTAMAQVIV